MESRDQPPGQAPRPEQLGAEVLESVARAPLSGGRQLLVGVRAHAREQTIVALVPGREQRQAEPVGSAQADLAEHRRRPRGPEPRHDLAARTGQAPVEEARAPGRQEAGRVLQLRADADQPVVGGEERAPPVDDVMVFEEVGGLHDRPERRPSSPGAARPAPRAPPVGRSKARRAPGRPAVSPQRGSGARSSAEAAHGSSAAAAAREQSPPRSRARVRPRASFVPLQADDDESADAVAPAQMHARRLPDVDAFVSGGADEPGADLNDAIAAPSVGAADRYARGGSGRPPARSWRSGCRARRPPRPRSGPPPPARSRGRSPDPRSRSGRRRAPCVGFSTAATARR